MHQLVCQIKITVTFRQLAELLPDRSILRRRNFITQQSQVTFKFEKRLGQENHKIIGKIIGFLKIALLHIFCSMIGKRKAGVFKFLWVEENFRKDPFA